jgi:phosphoribosylformylglycinamidine (FGAM) synthase PurS component
MQAYKIEILNPKAKSLLKNLEHLKLITISKLGDKEFIKFTSKLRSNWKTAPTLEEISQDVKQIRKRRYGRKQD